MTRDLARLAFKNLLRTKARTILTLLGLGLAVMLFAGIEAFGTGMAEALREGERSRTLLVYQAHRFCPQTSFLPLRHEAEIARIDGVRSVLPVRIVLNNCRTNLDMVTLQGAPPEALLANRSLEVIEGDRTRFVAQRDAALVGQTFARRRGLRVGDRFRFGEIDVLVAGIFRSDDAVQEALVLVHLDYLQRAAPVQRLAEVTQFEVEVDDPARAEAIAQAIDERFSTADVKTRTLPLQRFLARATQELQDILRFGRHFGQACVLVVLALLSNTLALSLQERRRELGVLRAVGFETRHVVRAVVLETALIAAFGGALGLLMLAALLHFAPLGIGVEGITISFELSPKVVSLGLAVTLGAALVSSLVQAWLAARKPILQALRGGG